MKGIVTSIVLCIVLMFSCSTKNVERTGPNIAPINYDLDLIYECDDCNLHIYYLFYKNKLIVSCFGALHIYTVIEKKPTSCKAVYNITCFDDGTVAKCTYYKKYEAFYDFFKRRDLLCGKNIYVDILNTNQPDLCTYEVYYYHNLNNGDYEKKLVNSILSNPTVIKILNNETVTAKYTGQYHSEYFLGTRSISGIVKQDKYGLDLYPQQEVRQSLLQEMQQVYWGACNTENDVNIYISNLKLKNIHTGDKLSITGNLYLDIDEGAGTLFFDPLTVSVEGKAKFELTEKQAEEKKLLGKMYTYPEPQ